MRQTFEHFLNTATVMKSPKPLSISIFDYLKRFDSGLRHDYEMREMLIFQCFSHFSLLNILITLLFPLLKL